MRDYAQDDEITAYIAGIDKKSRSVSLSVYTNEVTERRVRSQTPKTKTEDSTGPTTIGGLIKEQLEK